MNKFKMVITALFCLTLVACGGGDKVEGSYSTTGGMQELQFDSSGTVTQLQVGRRVAISKYEINGNEIKVLLINSTPQIFELQKNGDIKSAEGVIFKKK